LQTDYIDLYQVHWPDPLVNCEETAAAMKDVRGDEGKTTVKEGYSEKEEYKEKAKKKLNELDKKIEELEVKAKESGHEVKSEAHRGLNELKEKRAALNEDLSIKRENMGQCKEKSVRIDS